MAEGGKAPCEKLVEMLFTRYLLSAFPLGEATLYAPSSREEYLCGYDARIIGPSAFQEVLLQFKAPNLTRRGFTIYATEHQHRRLRMYPPRTAYYVAATFRSVDEILHAQNTTDPLDFLQHFLVVDAHCLPDDLRFIQYERDYDWLPDEGRYKVASDDNPWRGPLRVARRTIPNACTLSVPTMIARLQAKKVGSAVIVPPEWRWDSSEEAEKTVPQQWRGTIGSPNALDHDRWWGEVWERIPDEFRGDQDHEQHRILMLDRGRLADVAPKGAEEQDDFRAVHLRLPLKPR